MENFLYHSKILIDADTGTLPLAWKKDSVFMRHSEIFNVICMKNFYKMAAETIYKFNARKPLLGMRGINVEVHYIGIGKSSDF